MTPQISYSKIMFRDKQDLDVDFQTLFPGAVYLGARQRFKGNPKDIEVMCVKFTKVGKSTLEKYPNLKFVITRSHGLDNINMDLCLQKGVKVFALSPMAEECCDYIINGIEKYKCLEPYIIFGNGSISKLLQDYFQKRKVKYYVVNSITLPSDIVSWLRMSKTIISTLPYNRSTDEYFNDEIFEIIATPLGKEIIEKFSFISISRPQTLVIKDLIQSIKRCNVALIDTLSQNQLEKVNVTNIIHTNHTAWSTGFNKKNYLERIKNKIDSIISS